jgi:hypothetical protein
LRHVVQRIALALIVTNVRVVASRPHIVGKFLRDFIRFGTEYAPTLFIGVPRLDSQFTPGLIARFAASGVSVFVTYGVADIYD